MADFVKPRHCPDILPVRKKNSVFFTPNIIFVQDIYNYFSCEYQISHTRARERICTYVRTILSMQLGKYVYIYICTRVIFSAGRAPAGPMRMCDECACIRSPVIIIIA